MTLQMPGCEHIDMDMMLSKVPNVRKLKAQLESCERQTTPLPRVCYFIYLSFFVVVVANRGVITFL